jgi:hypothetical protein
MVLILGIVSIVCAAVGGAVFCCWPVGLVMVAVGFGTGIPAWVMGHRDLAKMTTGVMDPHGRGTTQGGWICGIIGTVLNIISLLVAASFGVIMLIGMMTAPPPAPPGPAPAPAPPPGRGRKMELDSGPPRMFAWMGRDRYSDRLTSGGRQPPDVRPIAAG